MKALLLAAGFGTRLRPLTNSIPKCLVPIGGKPLLQIWLERLANSGVDAFLVNTHYLEQKVDAFLDASAFKDKVETIYESELLGTAGTLLANIDFFNMEDGLLVHADNFCLANIQAFLEAHNNRPRYCLMTMMTFRTDNPQSCGIAELDEKGVVIDFHEKSELSNGNLANGAVYILSSELLDMLKNELPNVSDFSTQVLNRLLGRIYTYEVDDVFLDIGTPEAYSKANSLYHD